MNARSDQRKKLRKLRLELDPAEHRHQSARLCRRLAHHPLFLHARRIAAYLPAKGEVDCRSLIETAWQRGREVYLPVLRTIGHNRLWFARFEPDTRLVRNRFGIAEPDIDHARRIEPFALDLVLTPLVGFDAHGNRLGMGGGFYDRSFAYLHRRRHWFRPRLLGLAFECQRLARLPTEPWDIPLSAIATEADIIRFTPPPPAP